MESITPRYNSIKRSPDGGPLQTIVDSTHFSHYRVLRVLDKGAQGQAVLV